MTLVPLLMNGEASRENAVIWSRHIKAPRAVESGAPAKSNVDELHLQAMNALQERQNSLDRQASEITSMQLRQAQEVAQAQIERERAQWEAQESRQQLAHDRTHAMLTAQLRVANEDLQSEKLRRERDAEDASARLHNAVDAALDRARARFESELQSVQSAHAMETTQMRAHNLRLEQQLAQAQARLDQMEEEVVDSGNRWRKRAMEAEASALKTQSGQQVNRKVEEVRAMSEALRGADAETREAVLSVMVPNRQVPAPNAFETALDRVENSPLLQGVLQQFVAQRTAAPVHRPRPNQSRPATGRPALPPGSRPAPTPNAAPNAASTRHAPAPTPAAPAPASHLQSPNYGNTITTDEEF